MKSIQDNIRALSKESGARTLDNGNLQKLVAEGFSRKTSVIPGIMSLPSKGSQKAVNINAVKPIDYSKGMIDWSKSGNIDLMGKADPYVEPPTPPEPEEFSFGNALSFDGVNDYVSFNEGEIGDGRSTMTVSFWINLPSSSSAFYLGARSDNDVTNSWIIAKSPNTALGWVIQFRSNSTSYETYDSTKFNTYGEWVHIVCVYDGSEVFQTRIKMYFNGVYTGYNYIAPEPAESLPNGFGSNFNIGYNNYTGIATTECQLNELAIWYGKLTDEEIVGLYNEGNGDFATNYQPENLKRYYRFNGSGSDTVLIDEGLDGVDGTLNGFTSPPDYWVAHE